MSVLHEARHQHRRLEVGRRPCARVVVEQRALPHREPTLGPRRGVVGDRLDGQAAELRRQLGRVADGRAGEAERRVGAVLRAQSPQPSQHVRDVRAEHAAQHVQLVDHHVAQPHEERRPLRVRREDADVEHLGVREQHRRVGARPRPLVGRGVAVVGRCHELGEQPRRATNAAGLARAPWWGTRAARCPACPRAPTRRSAAGSRATCPTRCRSRARRCVRRGARRRPAPGAPTTR